MKRLLPSAMRPIYTGEVDVAEIFLSASTPSHPKIQTSKISPLRSSIVAWLVGNLNFFLEAPEAL
jgi:hypothetical protein